MQVIVKHFNPVALDCNTGNKELSRKIRFDGRAVDVAPYIALRAVYKPVAKWKMPDTDKPQHIAAALDLAWRFTNSVDQDWVALKHSQLEVINDGIRHRSSSVGDIMMVALDDGTPYGIYTVASNGFEEI